MHTRRSYGRRSMGMVSKRLWLMYCSEGSGVHCAWKINVFPSKDCDTGCQKEDGEVEEAVCFHVTRGVRWELSGFK